MPAKNSVKIYAKDGYYHSYNRGVEKRNIFLDDQDYKVFLSYIKQYLEPPPDETHIVKKDFTLQGQTFKGVPRMPNNYFGKIELIAFCLMPNHWHLMLKQLETSSMPEFVRSLTTRYSMYFNKKYKRVGNLFQGRYKAILIDNQNYLVHLSRYLHLNPSEFTNDLASTYSSYGDYLGLRHTNWLKPDIVLNEFNTKVAPEFKKVNNYKDFVENYKQEDKLILGNLSID